MHALMCLRATACVAGWGGAQPTLVWKEGACAWHTTAALAPAAHPSNPGCTQRERERERRARGSRGSSGQWEQERWTWAMERSWGPHLQEHDHVLEVHGHEVLAPVHEEGAARVAQELAHPRVLCEVRVPLRARRHGASTSVCVRASVPALPNLRNAGHKHARTHACVGCKTHAPLRTWGGRRAGRRPALITQH